MGNLNLDLTNVDTSKGGGWRALPAGTYRLMITSATTRELRSGNGTALSLECQVLGGDHGGKTLFENLNVIHSNDTAQQIAQRILATLLDSVGIARNGLEDAAQLSGKSVVAEIKKSKAREGYGDADGFQNSIVAFSAVNGAVQQSQPVVDNSVAENEIPF
jgi:hypothetical protein